MQRVSDGSVLLRTSNAEAAVGRLRTAAEKMQVARGGEWGRTQKRELEEKYKMLAMWMTAVEAETAKFSSTALSAELRLQKAEVR